MNATTFSSAEGKGNQGTGQQRAELFGAIIEQINNDTDFAVVAQAILRAACQQVKAREAVLLAMEREATPLLRASFKVEEPAPTDVPSSANQASSNQAPVLAPPDTPTSLHRVAIRSAGRLVGLLELQRDSATQISASEQRNLEVLANLAALLIYHEHAAEMEAVLDAKMGQFESHKEQFIHLISHQLRTPLTSIKGFAQLLVRKAGGNPETIERYSSTILQETDRLNTMVNNLMELSRMETAMVGIHRVPFDLNEVVSQTLDRANNEQQIKSSLAPKLPVCSGDPAVLSQALTTLIDHALQSTHQLISISTAQVDHHLNLELALAADAWPERPSDDLQSISLSQAVDSSDKQNPALALYVVRNLTQAMGGDISLARSNPEASSQNTPLRYILSLPLAGGADSLYTETRLRLETGWHWRKSMSKILVVDDESSIVELIEENLTMEGYETSHAYSGEEALELMRHTQPDLVLLDVMMPGMDGYEVSRQMQADPTLNHIPIIMLTARASTPDKVMGYAKGVDDYITKPFDSDELLVRVRAQLHHLYHEDISDIADLPGSQAVEDAIKQRTNTKGKPWNIIYIDIERFTTYNENYSFLEGDELIKATANLLREVIKEKGNPTDFLGHSGGDNFVVITTPDKTRAVCQQAAERFSAIIPQYYTASDRNQGYVLALRHDGQIEQSPLAELSFDVVGNEED